MNFLPVLIVGGAFIAISSKKKRRRITSKNGAKALPPPNKGRGEIFKGDDPPDMIVNSVGSRFTVIFPEIPGTGHVWELSASPPDNSIEVVATETEEVPAEGVGGHQANRVFIFEGQKKGEGSLVFHLVRPWMKGKEPPVEIVEIQTRIS
jgi:predicted secreted protein